MKILITGAAGFIGSNLCEYMLEKGHTVVGFDNFATGHAHNLNDFDKHLIFLSMEGDIRNLETCLKATQNIDYVLHQAALGSVPRSLKDPITSNEVNVSGFLNMLEASKQNQVKRFVYAASSSTYGDSKALPKVEEKYRKTFITLCITKYVNELYAEIYSNTYRTRNHRAALFQCFWKETRPQWCIRCSNTKICGTIFKRGKSNNQWRWNFFKRLYIH